MAKSPKPRNRSAQDTTLINLRAPKKRVEALEARVKKLERHIVKPEDGNTTIASEAVGMTPEWRANAFAGRPQGGEE